VLANLVNRADVWVVERRGRTCFALKAVERLAILCHLFRQELQRYQAAECEVLGLVHHTHAAATQLF
jgi:hypothetical protein